MTVAPKERMLVIEDDVALAKFLKTLLESFSYHVHVEGSGAPALHDAAEHRPDLVILDLKLPDIDGYEVCRQLRKLYNKWDVPILMLTGMDQPIDQLRGFAHGADAYLTKPCEPHELLKTIARLLGETAPA